LEKRTIIQARGKRRKICSERRSLGGCIPHPEGISSYVEKAYRLRTRRPFLLRYIQKLPRKEGGEPSRKPSRVYEGGYFKEDHTRIFQGESRPPRRYLSRTRLVKWGGKRVYFLLGGGGELAQGTSIKEYLY